MKSFTCLALFALALAATPGRADPLPVNLPALAALSARPDLGRGAFVDRLHAALPHFAPAAGRMPALAETDPYYWAISGHFGPPLTGAPAPGGVLVCARYGRITMETLAPLDSTDPGVFPLLQQTLILSDDAAAWPDHAVARLACSITWDDGRRVAPLGAGAVEDALLTLFDEVVLGPDPRERPGQVRVFGPGGYRISGVGRHETSVFRLDLFEVDQLATHQQILFRSFLAGGGV